MLYRMNLPTWERWGRGLIGVGLVVLGGDGAVGYSHRMGLGRIGRDHAVERVRRLLPDVRAGRPQTSSRKRIVSRSHHGCAA
jgi:hypothetical protein